MQIIRPIVFRPFRDCLAAMLLALASAPLLAANGPVVEVAAKVEKLSSADRSKIQRVINLQIRAFERNDGTVAFSYSTPETRKYFGSSRSFMELVRAEYSVLFQHVSREFLDA